MQKQVSFAANCKTGRPGSTLHNLEAACWAPKPLEKPSTICSLDSMLDIHCSKNLREHIHCGKLLLKQTFLVLALRYKGIKINEWEAIL